MFKRWCEWGIRLEMINCNIYFFAISTICPTKCLIAKHRAIFCKWFMLRFRTSLSIGLASSILFFKLYQTISSCDDKRTSSITTDDIDLLNLIMAGNFTLNFKFRCLRIMQTSNANIGKALAIQFS